MYLREAFLLSVQHWLLNPNAHSQIPEKSIFLEFDKFTDEASYCDCLLHQVNNEQEFHL